MTLSNSFKKRSKTEADAVVDKATETLESMQTTFKAHFPFETLSEAQKVYAANDDSLTQNASVVAALEATRDTISTGISHMQTLDTYITMHIPQMEDGNNFGVTVQLTALKQITEMQEKWTKSLDSIPSYFTARADAVDKLGLSKQSTSETSSTSKSESAGGKDGEESKTSKSVTTEAKTSASGKPEYHRVQHVYALDVQQYFTLKVALRSVMEGYLVVLDNLIKNRTKIEEPKGSGGGNFGAMY